MKKIYLAGPIVFYADPVAKFDRMKEICAKHGLQGCAPIDNQMGLEGDGANENLMLQIAKADLELCDQCDMGIFCLDPFRRCPEMDPGTAVEIGYMYGQGKPLAGWTVDGRLYPDKVKAFLSDHFDEEPSSSTANEEGATSGALRDSDGLLLHSAGMVQNLMTQGAIELSGGKVYIDSNWEIAFENAVKKFSE
jgi:nucleoside 2-deoxyribosyltransferase